FKDFEDIEISKLVPASNFKLAGKDRVIDIEALVIEYAVALNDQYALGGKAKVKLWINAQTMLPVKRHLILTGAKENLGLVREVYSEFTLEPRIDAKVFELPKK